MQIRQICSLDQNVRTIEFQKDRIKMKTNNGNQLKRKQYSKSRS